ncbi:MAG: phage tail protein [Eubacterium sp.]|nr:phage tail protein [Eubacterium sp.]
MICIYEKTETSFTYNGLGTLEPTYCSYSPLINDVWKLEMYLPYDSEGKYMLVANGRILKVTGIDCIQEQTSDYQLFYIETYRKEGNSIYVLAYPIGLNARFDTYANQVKAEYKTAAQAIALINAVKAITLNNQQIDKYTVSTDISAADLNSAVWNNTNIISMLTNDENGFIHKWGGEVCYDNYNIKVNQSLGRTSGASEVRYGKNIRGMSYEEDTSNVITRLYPVANGGEILNGIDAYKIANTQYVDSTNVLDYPIPHIAYTNAPYNLVQMSDDGSETYAASILAFNQIKEDAYAWIRDALLGENTGGVDGLLVDIELAWFQENYGLTMDNDGTEGLVEYITNKICNDSTRPIRSSAVKNLIYNAIKAGFEEILNESSFPSTKKLWSTFYSYTWDERGNFRVNKNGDAEYAWVYASSKWNQLDNDGYLTGAVDSATWKWYKVSGKKYKRYGNKKKKRYLRSQWWNINGVWYWFDDEGEATSGADLQSSCYDMFDSMNVSGESIYEALDYCQGTEAGLFELLYTQMTNYCSNLFVTEKISYPAPSITIDMVDLSKTVEYAGYENLLKIKLGDTVKCVNTKLNISTDLRVTGLTYDVLKGCNTNIQIGLTETSIIKEFDKSGNIIVSQKYSAGDGIKIEGNVISATGINLTDVVVGGQSVVYGGKAYIDIDEISGEGLQWFEETEDALFGYSTELALIDDNAYKISTAGNTITMSSSQTGETLDIAVSGDDSTLLIYYPYAYFSKAQTIIEGINVGNYGNALVLSKSSFSVLTTMHPASGSVNPTVYASFSSSSSDGWKDGYIINPTTGEHEYGYNGPITFHGNAQVNGETWYMVMIGYNYQYTMSNTNRSLINYLPVAQYPSGDIIYNAAYETVADLIQATVPLTRSSEGGSFNGISREGNLAFFAGADDEHGLNAPIKIYKDGTYEGLDKIEDVKVDNVSVVTSKVANINTMTGATSGSSGIKGLVPRPLSADREKYLKGDGTWGTPSGASDMQGATAQSDGVHGLVPQPLIANKDQFLKGDGTWATPTDTQYSDFDGTTHGLVPAPSSGDSGYLKVDGTWDEPEGTTVVANPSGTATADLTSLQVGTDIYSIPSGGGGGLDVSEYDNWYHVYYTEVLTDEQTGNNITLNVDEVITGYFYIDKSSESSSVAYSEWLSQGMEVTGYALQADQPIEGIIETIEEARDGIYVNYRIKNTSGLYCSRVQVLTRWAIPKSGSSGGGSGVDLSLEDNWDLFTNAPSYTSHTLVAGDKIKGVWSINKTSLRDSDRHTATDRALILQDFSVFARDSNGNTVSLDVTVSGYGDVNTAMDVYYIATNNTSTDVAEIAYGVFFRSPKAGSGGGGGASALDDLTDVDITSPADGQVLKYDSTNSKWVNANESGGGGGGINYSTTEQDTGLTWIDGRPVYQKTYYSGTVAQGVSVLDSGFTATLYDHVWQTDIHWRYFSINIDIGNHGGTGGAIYIESYNNQGLYAVNSTGVDITDLYFTIRYTKTADIQS